MAELVHKRSNLKVGNKAKAPNASDLEFGELAVNYVTDDPAIFIRDSADNVVRIAGNGATGVPDIDDGTQQPGTLDDRYVNYWRERRSEG